MRPSARVSINISAITNIITNINANASPNIIAIINISAIVIDIIIINNNPTNLITNNILTNSNNSVLPALRARAPMHKVQWVITT